MGVLIGLAEKVGLEPKRVSSTHGGEFHCACPSCGGQDRFYIQPSFVMENCTGRYACRQCKIWGDSIEFCREFLAMDWNEAVSTCNANFEFTEKQREKPKVPWGNPSKTRVAPPSVCPLTT